MDDDWLTEKVRERREREARLAAEVADLAGDAPAPVQAEAQPQPSNVVPFRLPSKWPHKWNSPNAWHDKGGWNGTTQWQGRPRVYISNRSAGGTDDDQPPEPPMAA